MKNPYDISETDRVCRAFTYASLQTWEDLRDDPTLGEDSITDYRLLLLKRHCPDEVEVIKFNRRKEANTGADWEWWFGAKDQWFGMRVQAKKLDIDTLAYKHLDHRIGSSNELQVDRLIQDAGSRGLFPMYSFYNYWDADAGPNTWRCQTFERRPALWGNSVAAAEVVQKLVMSGTKSAFDVAESALPITCLACCRGHAGIDDPTLPYRARGVAMYLGTSKVPPLVSKLPHYVASAASRPVENAPGGQLDLDGILVIRERSGPYDEDTRRPG